MRHIPVSESQKIIIFTVGVCEIIIIIIRVLGHIAIVLILGDILLGARLGVLERVVAGIWHRLRVVGREGVLPWEIMLRVEILEILWVLEILQVLEILHILHILEIQVLHVWVVHQIRHILEVLEALELLRVLEVLVWVLKVLEGISSEICIIVTVALILQILHKKHILHGHHILIVLALEIPLVILK